MMGELTEPRWAVTSERGAESFDLTYEAARKLALKLKEEKIRGLCIITNAAAGRITGEKKEADHGILLNRTETR